MKTIEQIINSPRSEVVCNIHMGLDGLALTIEKDKRAYVIIASWGARWDHVSMSLRDRCPTWEEMCWAKDLFWNENETVVQYHPAKEHYINNHPFCLHLWKPQKQTLILPPDILIGLK